MEGKSTPAGPMRASKCRCGASALPESPIAPITCPQVTVSSKGRVGASRQVSIQQVQRPWTGAPVLRERIRRAGQCQGLNDAERRVRQIQSCHCWVIQLAQGAFHNQRIPVRKAIDDDAGNPSAQNSLNCHTAACNSFRQVEISQIHTVVRIIAARRGWVVGIGNLRCQRIRLITR